MIAKLEAIRPRFDTPVAPFLADLRSTGAPEAPHEQALVEFRCFSLGGIDAAYPITRHAMPWKHHRVAITRAELDAAGYVEFKRLWSSGEPFADVPVGGEIPLGPYAWVYQGRTRADLVKPRGELLRNLAKVLEATR